MHCKNLKKKPAQNNYPATHQRSSPLAKGDSGGLIFSRHEDLKKPYQATYHRLSRQIAMRISGIEHAITFIKKGASSNAFFYIATTLI